MNFLARSFFIFGFILIANISCSSSSSGSAAAYSLSLEFTRIDQVGYSPFRVRTTLTDLSGTALSGQTLSLSVPNGVISAVTDNQNGTYDFTVTPSTSGTYPVQVSFGGASIRRVALVGKTLATGTGVGQPLEVPGDYVNTIGYEDGITITPDGNYLFVQYGPIYFGGLFFVSSICSSASYTLYDILGCGSKSDSGWIFDTIGPYNNYLRPGFPTGAISNGHLTHLNLVVPGVANGIALFPTVFYGFKKQSDGTFAEPFKVSFNDAKGAQGPFGLSLQMTSATTAKFVVAYNNYFNDLGGDQKPDIYQGTLVMGQTNNLGDVTYSGEMFSSITPNITPMTFTSHAGVQGNPHLYYDTNGVVKSIWTDDEQTTHDLAVYRIISGTFPTGTWSLVTLPSIINTTASESQPFFTGTRLYLTRDTKIVYHDYIGSGGTDYNLNSSWGPEHILLSSGESAIGNIFGFGEPTLATVNGKTYLYFAVVKVRSEGVVSSRYDYNLDAGFVEIP